VSGGADSTALLHALAARRRTAIAVVAHYNHAQRAQASDDDAHFVHDLARQLGLPTASDRFDRSLDRTNRSAQLRAARLAFFRSVVAAHRCRGILLAHHADDQAETVLLRLIRGGGALGLRGIAPTSQHRELIVAHPLLNVRRTTLRSYLTSIGAAWREDESNASSGHARNRVRSWLAARPALAELLIEIAGTAGRIGDRLGKIAPTLPETFAAGALADLPAPIARFSARRWLIEHGAIRDDLNEATCDRLARFAADASTGPAIDFPGVHVRRRRGIISAEPSIPAPAAPFRQSLPSTDLPAHPARSTPRD
jgi:tRNA(Ile)-lysidine synthase